MHVLFWFFFTLYFISLVKRDVFLDILNLKVFKKKKIFLIFFSLPHLLRWSNETSYFSMHGEYCFL